MDFLTFYKKHREQITHIRNNHGSIYANEIIKIWDGIKKRVAEKTISLAQIHQWLLYGQMVLEAATTDKFVKPVRYLDSPYFAIAQYLKDGSYSIIRKFSTLKEATQCHPFVINDTSVTIDSHLCIIMVAPSQDKLISIMLWQHIGGYWGHPLTMEASQDLIDDAKRTHLNQTVMNAL